MEVKGLVIQFLRMGDASHLTGGAISVQVFNFISFTLALTFLTDGTIGTQYILLHKCKSILLYICIYYVILYICIIIYMYF